MYKKIITKCNNLLIKSIRTIANRTYNGLWVNWKISKWTITVVLLKINYTL